MIFRTKVWLVYWALRFLPRGQFRADMFDALLRAQCDEIARHANTDRKGR